MVLVDSTSSSSSLFLLKGSPDSPPKSVVLSGTTVNMLTPGRVASIDRPGLLAKRIRQWTLNPPILGSNPRQSISAGVSVHNLPALLFGHLQTMPKGSSRRF